MKDLSLTHQGRGNHQALHTSHTPYMVTHASYYKGTKKKGSDFSAPRLMLNGIKAHANGMSLTR